MAAAGWLSVGNPAHDWASWLNEGPSGQELFASFTGVSPELLAAAPAPGRGSITIR